MFNWKPKNLTGKPDFYTVLKRRNRQLSDFLETAQIKSFKDLEDLCSGLEHEYVVSEEMIQESLKYISLQNNSLQEPVENSANLLTNPVEENLQPLESEKKKSKRKPKENV